MWVILFWVSAVPARAEVLVHECRNRSAAQLAEAIRPLLGEDGELTVDAAANRLIVRAKASLLADIREALERLDAAAETMRVRIELADADFLAGLGEDIRWTQKGGWRTATAPRDPTIGGRKVHYSSSAQASAREYRVQAGEALTVPIGRPVPRDRVRAVVVGRLGPGINLDSATVQAALIVTPSTAGDRILLNIEPTLSVMRDASLETRSLGSAMTVSLARGERAYFGLEEAARTGLEGLFFEAVGVEATSASGGLVWSLIVDRENDSEETP